MPFLPGVSGNPKGRPRRTDADAPLRERIRKACPRIIDALVTAAEAGDVTAGKALLTFVLPPYRPVDRPVAITLPTDLSDLSGATSAVLTGLATGTLTPDQAGAVAQVLGTVARVREYAELEDRLAHLEELLHATSTPTT